MATKNGILSVELTNFKQFSNFEAELNGKSLFLIGDNEVGKSTFMQAIFSLLGNEPFPVNAIKKGQTEGEVKVTFVVEGKKYTAKKKFTEKNPKGYFELTAEDGMKTNSVSVLSDLVGNISFNPFEFVELSNSAEGRRKQVKLIRTLLSAETNAQIDQAEQLYDDNYKKRAELNSELKNLTAQLKQYKFSEADFKTYAEPVKVEKLQADLQKIQEREIDEKLLKDAVKEASEELASIEAKINELIERKERTLKRQAASEQGLKVLKPLSLPSKDEINAQIRSAADHNLKVKEIAQYSTLKATEEAKTKARDKAETNCTRCLEKKSELIANSDLPVKGLSFDENGITLNGLEVNEDQISTSEIMELGVKIQTAINPKLKILAIPRAESLGKKKTDAIVKFCKRNKFQLFGEKVDADAPKLTIQFIED